MALNAFLARPLVFQASTFTSIKIMSTGRKSLITNISRGIMDGPKLWAGVTEPVRVVEGQAVHVTALDSDAFRR
ncbi:hypothetical protein D3C72_536440 [compost metagenome]